METQQSPASPAPAYAASAPLADTIQHLDLKFPLLSEGGSAPEGGAVPDSAMPDFGALIPVFHRWIRERVCDELLIDVADYRHVPAGPGVVLVGLEGTYSLDLTDRRPGLRYVRKAEVPGGLRAALAQGLRALDHACRLLEQDAGLGGRFQFYRKELELRVNARLLAPNRRDTFVALKPELERAFAVLLGDGAVTLEYTAKPREVFKVTVRSTVPIGSPI
jgi:hypothetical protein